MVIIAACLMILIQKCQRVVTRSLLLESSKIIEVYSKTIDDYDCNRMRQNVVYDFVKTAK
jgi:hypothetical protein